MNPLVSLCNIHTNILAHTAVSMVMALRTTWRSVPMVLSSFGSITATIHPLMSGSGSLWGRSLPEWLLARAFGAFSSCLLLPFLRCPNIINQAYRTIRLADLDGDGLADYLVVDEQSGAVVFWRNGGRQDDGMWSVSDNTSYLISHDILAILEMIADFLIPVDEHGPGGHWYRGWARGSIRRHQR